MTDNYFPRKGIRDGDPISTLFGIFWVYIMFRWLTTASITPYQTPATAANLNLVTTFNFLLIIMIPLGLGVVFQHFASQKEIGLNAPEPTGLAERKLSPQVRTFIERSRARREERRQRKAISKLSKR